MKTLSHLLAVFMLINVSVSAQEAKHIANHVLEEKRAGVYRIGMNRNHNIPQSDSEKQVDKVITDKLSSEHLMKLGVMFYLYSYPGRAEDVHMDNIFDYASRRCASLISQRSGNDAGNYLKQMKAICGTDGGGSLTYKRLIETQKKVAEQAAASDH